jgi:hypothetical protein
MAEKTVRPTVQDENGPKYAGNVHRERLIA